MKRFFVLVMAVFLIAACRREEDLHHNETDTSFPVVTLISPVDSSVFHNGDTIFISGMVTDNELHSGTIILKNDTTAAEYFNQYHYVHELSSANINYYYIVNGITQNEAVTLTATYEDHIPNTTAVTRHLVFMP